ncbi:MAG: Fic family protein [Phycisphaerae bacterium]
MMYIHERGRWPEFQWDANRFAALLADVRHLQGHLLGRMESLGFQLCQEARLETLAQDVVKTSAIEGQVLDTQSVRSSLARRMGVDIGALPQIDRNVEGIVEVMLDATGNFSEPVTRERLFGWHAALFPTGRSGLRRITVGSWRTKESGPMQVVSGPIGREQIHYEAPGRERLKKEMACFIKWCNRPGHADPVINSAIAHFWFVTIHPFEDGNGRIARAIADMFLARSEKTQQRFYSMSAQIQKERNSYYDVLESCQKGTLDITTWIHWFLLCMQRAIGASERMLEAVLIKSRFWKAHADESFNDRQRKVLNRLLNKFEGNLTTSKWAILAKCSQDTALRDIGDLLQRRVLIRDQAGGRSTKYTLCLPK